MGQLAPGRGGTPGRMGIMSAMSARPLSIPAALVLCLTSTSIVSSRPSPNERRRFERWLDGEARRALDESASLRREASSSVDGVHRRAADVRARVLEAMGGLPGELTPLDARITGSLVRDGYTIEHLVFESMPGFFVTANVYRPHGVGAFPAVLGTAGHSDAGKAADVYQRAWVSLARRGMLVLAYDPPGQGERLEYFDESTGESRLGAGTPEHTHVGQQCLLTGTSVARYFAWDGVRAIDYLLTRPDVDPQRLGVAGNSGGGTQAAWLAVVEPRLSAVVSSCYVTSWSALWSGPGPQDMEQVLPGFLAKGLDFADLLMAAAPRPYLVSSALRDFFPIAGARATVAEARAAYSSLDAADRVNHIEHDAEHGWSKPLREGAYAWLAKWWHGGSGAAAATEGEVQVEPVEMLRATTTGQVSTSFDARTIFDLNRDRARRLAATRPPATKARLRALVQMLDDPRPPRVLEREIAEPLNGLKSERLDLVGGDGLALPARLLHPSSVPRGTVLMSADRGDPVDSAPEWSQRGYLTLVLHVRGIGELGPGPGASGYASDYQLAARAWLLGTSVVAWQTRDLIAGLLFLEAEAPAAGERVLAVAGTAGPAGFFAAALHPVHVVRAEQTLVSYLDLASTPHYEAAAPVFVPGVLEVTDLPELMALASPGMVHLVRPVAADGRLIHDVAALQGLIGTVPPNVRLER